MLCESFQCQSVVSAILKALSVASNRAASRKSGHFQVVRRIAINVENWQSPLLLFDII